MALHRALPVLAAPLLGLLGACRSTPPPPPAELVLFGDGTVYPGPRLLDPRRPEEIAALRAYLAHVAEAAEEADALPRVVLVVDPHAPFARIQALREECERAGIPSPQVELVQLHAPPPTEPPATPAPPRE